MCWLMLRLRRRCSQRQDMLGKLDALPLIEHMQSLLKLVNPAIGVSVRKCFRACLLICGVMRPEDRYCWRRVSRALQTISSGAVKVPPRIVIIGATVSDARARADRGGAACLSGRAWFLRDADRVCTLLLFCLVRAGPLRLRRLDVRQETRAQGGRYAARCFAAPCSCLVRAASFLGGLLAVAAPLRAGACAVPALPPCECLV
mgnify:CR=1 FL=1